MSPVACPDCGREGFDTAPACLGCGRAFAHGAPPKTAIRLGTSRLVVSACALGGVVLIAIGVSVRDRPGRAPVSQAQSEARALHPAAEKYRVEHPSEPCPTMEVLRAKLEISSMTPIVDPWGTTYAVVCNGEDDVTIVSAGPDKTLRSGDDIRVPEGL
jgi:hypothetical protein